MFRTRRRGGGCAASWRGRRAVGGVRGAGCRARRRGRRRDRRCRWAGVGGDRRRVRGRGCVCGLGAVGPVAVRVGGERREAAGRPTRIRPISSSAGVVSCLRSLRKGRERRNEMDNDQQEAVALHRFGVIAEATNPRLTPAERGAVVRHDRGRGRTRTLTAAERRYSRPTIDRWIRAWRAGGLDALTPGRAGRSGRGAGASGAVRRGGRPAPGAPVALGRPDRLDPLSPPRDPGRGAHGAGPAASGRAAPRGAGG